MSPYYFKKTITFSVLLLMAALLAACSEGGGAQGSADAGRAIEKYTISQAIEQLGSAQNPHHQKALKSSQNLSHLVETFLAAPDEETLELLKISWLQTHHHFLAARFFSLIQADPLNFQVDAWPIQEGFLDRLPQYPHSGIISDVTLPINSTTLKAQHGLTDPEEVSLGFHALEFLLFDRNLDDYSLQDDSITERRRQTLAVITEVLGHDLESMLSRSRSASSGTIDLSLVLDALYSRVSILFVEANDISEISGHSRFSRSSWLNLQTQVAVLSELTGEQTKLGHVLLLLDQNITAEYRLILTEAEEILLMDDPGEENRSRLPLLLAALGHQLGDLKSAHDRTIN